MRSTSLILLLCLFSAAALPAQNGKLETFGEMIDVRVLNLEVAVSDKDGAHVAGLEPQDFRLLIDGDEVAIEYFSEIRQGAARTQAGFSAVPSVTPGEVVAASYLLFVDNFFGHARDRQVVLEEILGTLADLGPKDRMAVVAFDGHELELLGNWSSSPESIAESLRAAMDQPAYGLQRLGEANIFEAQLRSQTAGLIAESDLNTVTEYVRRLSRQVDTVVKAATTAMRTMAGPPGRKVLLLTSGGWPEDPAIYAVGFDQPQTEVRFLSKTFSPKTAFKDLAGTANLLGYTIYPIDLPGKQDFAAGRGAATGETTDDFGRLTERENTVESPLLVLAEETGGRAMLNGLRQNVMPRVRDDIGSYYWLGYTPKWQYDDEQHEVRVEVLRPGLVSRSRKAFRDLSRQAEVTMMVESQLLFSTPLSDASLEVAVGPAKKARRGRLELPVELKIPLDDVLFLPVAGGFEARLELRVAVIDDQGKRSEIPVIPVTLGGEGKPPAGAHAIYETSLKLRKIRQRLALALYDVVGEKILSTAIELDPASI